MRIKNYKLSDHGTSINGLRFKEMSNLKQVVAIFGVNGAGKTRLLNTLQGEINSKLQNLRGIQSQINGAKGAIKMNKNSANNTLRRIDSLREQRGDFSLEGKVAWSSVDNEIEDLRAREIDYRNEVLRAEAEAAKLEKKKEEFLSEFKYLTEDEISSNFASVIEIKPLDNFIEGHENMSESDYRGGALDLELNPSFVNVKQNCTKFIKSLCKSDMALDYHKVKNDKKYFTHHDKIQEKNIKLLGAIKEMVSAIMGKKLDYATDEHLTPIVLLNDRNLRLDELSEGERELLVFCVFFVLQNQDDLRGHELKGKIISIDEPDLFLHPKAQIDLINGLRKLVGENGQIWIATHSLSILSVLNKDEIWLMENGNIVSPSIETPSKALASLIGEDNISSLENFISSQYEWAAIQFALESLFPPSVAEFKESDAQQKQVLEKLSSPKKPLRVLDFGAGKGRIAQEIIKNPNVASNIYYQPLESDRLFHAKLGDLTNQLQGLSAINTGIIREVLDTHEKLYEAHYQSFYDVILLINVLHEIPVNKWQVILNAILSSLKDDGILLILEDQAIPKGENANEYGFIILDVEEFKLLFSLDNPPKVYTHSDPKYASRLSCIEIVKGDTDTITTESITEALRRKKSNCKTLIKELRRKDNKTSSDGRRNSFLTQLYANVDMAIQENFIEVKGVKRDAYKTQTKSTK